MRTRLGLIESGARTLTPRARQAPCSRRSTGDGALDEAEGAGDPGVGVREGVHTADWPRQRRYPHHARTGGGVGHQRAAAVARADPLADPETEATAEARRRHTRRADRGAAEEHLRPKARLQRRFLTTHWSTCLRNP